MTVIHSTNRQTSPRLTFALLAVGSASFSMLQSLVSPALPTLQQEFGTTQSAISWVLIAWLLSTAVATTILGRLGDIIGKERALTLALGSVVVGSVVAALAPNLGTLLAGRVIQGLGGAMFPLAFGIIRDEFPRERMPSAVGAMSGVIAVGGGLGMLLAGPISAFGWRWLFWVPAVVAGVTAVLARLFVPASPVRSPGRIGWLGSTLLAGWLVALLLPVTQGASWGWDAPGVLALFGAAVVLAVLWVVVESRSPNPVIDLRLMRRPVVWRTNLAAALVGATMFAVWTFLPLLVQTPRSAGYGFGASVSQAGLLILPMLVAMAVASMFSGRLAAAEGSQAQVAWGAGIMAVSTAGLAAFHASFGQIALATGAFGLGLGVAYAALTTLVVQNVPPEQTGAATGMNTNIRAIGGAFGAAAMSAIVTSSPHVGAYPAESGFTTGFLVLAVAAAAAVWVALLVPGRRSAAVVASEPETAETPVLVAAD